MKYRKETLDHSYLKSILQYDPESGKIVSLVSLVTRWKGRITPGDCLGGIDPSTGYIRLMIDGVSYFVHRLAFFYMTGEWPREQVDHINGDRTDNRWINLRQATARQNKFNRSANKTNITGYKGVSWDN